MSNKIEKYMKENTIYSNLDSQELNESQKLFATFTKEIFESILDSVEILPT